MSFYFDPGIVPNLNESECLLASPGILLSQMLTVFPHGRAEHTAEIAMTGAFELHISDLPER